MQKQTSNGHLRNVVPDIRKVTYICTQERTSSGHERKGVPDVTKVTYSIIQEHTSSTYHSRCAVAITTAASQKIRNTRQIDITAPDITTSDYIG